MFLPKIYFDDIIKKALLEDINYIDVTTDNLMDDDKISHAVFMAKEKGVLCGIDIAIRVIEMLDDDLNVVIYKNDGCSLLPGDIIAEVTGKTKALLKGERTALNLLQHMSGIATAADRAVKIVSGFKASIADTRKTMPGLRALQKYAVTVGGGKNHRFNLSDAAMIKDNHIDAVGSITKAVSLLRQKVGHTVKIEVETRSLDELREAIEAGADIIMLDNMSCETMIEAVKITAGRALLEASGNITDKNLLEVAKTGVDIISLGALTHTVKALDISMKIK